jgi:DNA repair exonuclease SbcCD ATPase subunit
MSVHEQISQAKEAVARFKKNKCYALWLDSKIAIDKAALKNSIRLLAEYQDSVERLGKSVKEKEDNLELLNRFLANNPDTEDKMAEVESIVAKLKKLQLQKDALQSKLTELESV